MEEMNIYPRPHNIKNISRVNFDATRLQSLAKYLPEQRVQEFGYLFIESIGKHLELIRAAIPDDLVEVGKEAHDIIGSAAVFGAPQLGCIGRKLVAACKIRDHERSSDLFDELIRATEAVIEEFHVWCEAVPALPTISDAGLRARKARLRRSSGAKAAWRGAMANSTPPGQNRIGGNTASQ